MKLKILLKERDRKAIKKIKKPKNQNKLLGIICINFL